MMDHRITQLGLIDDDALLLDDAALTLAGIDHPEIDLEPYFEVIDDLAARLAAVGAGVSEGKARAALIAQVIAQDGGFVGDRDTYDDPDNADLIRVIDRRRGLPVSLSILYVAVARRVGWVADALDVPGHVLVLIGDDSRPIVIDPFRAGMVVDSEGLAALVAAAAGGHAPAVRHIAAMPNRAILARLLRNQAMRAEAAGKGRRALTLYERITAFAPDDGDAWWHRARLELTDGDVPAGRASLAAMLEITRDPAVRERVADMLSALSKA